jgi:hypothetical protein
MNSLIQQLNCSSLDSNEGDVQIINYNSDYEITNILYTYKKILIQSPVIKEWFEKVDFYGDYIEINDYLSLYNKSDDYSYSLVIQANNDYYYLIRDIIDYLKGKRVMNYSEQLLHHLYLLQVI